MKKSIRETGVYQQLGSLSHFIPYPLPPINPALALNPELISLYGEASFALGQLEGMSLKLPDPKRFIKAYVIKEALLSSAIEGIHTTLVDAFTSPIGESKPNKDTQLVLNYTKALEASFSMLKDENLPLVSRVILRAHKELMSSGDGDKASPGLYRKQSVRVGDLIPPPAPKVPELMSQLEKYINEVSELPPLIRAGLVHVQFETIHPFLDGNGRIGRLLIVLMFIDSGLLSLPILYPSYYFKKHHSEYYEHLSRVRTEGDFEGWIIYYLNAIKESALDAYARAKEIEILEIKLKDFVRQHPKFSRVQELACLVLDFLFVQPVASITQISEQLGKVYNTISKVMKLFVEVELVSESKMSKRNKLHYFDPYLALLEKEY